MKDIVTDSACVFSRDSNGEKGGAELLGLPTFLADDYFKAWFASRSILEPSLGEPSYAIYDPSLLISWPCIPVDLSKRTVVIREIAGMQLVNDPLLRLSAFSNAIDSMLPLLFNLADKTRFLHLITEASRLRWVALALLHADLVNIIQLFPSRDQTQIINNILMHIEFSQSNSSGFQYQVGRYLFHLIPNDRDSFEAYWIELIRLLFFLRLLPQTLEWPVFVEMGARDSMVDALVALKVIRPVADGYSLTSELRCNSIK